MKVSASDFRSLGRKKARETRLNLYAPAVDQLLATDYFSYTGASQVPTEVETIWPLTDLNGNVVLLASADGLPTNATHISSSERVRYDSFGIAGDDRFDGVVDELKEKVRARFRGWEFDHDAALYQLGGQGYDPESGRLMSPNRSAAPGANPYTLDGNSPDNVRGRTNAYGQRQSNFGLDFGGDYRHYMTENGAAIRRAGDGWAAEYEEAGFRSGSFSTTISHAVDAQFLRMGTGIITAMADPLGTAEAVNHAFYASLRQSEQYYREGGGGLNGTLLQVAYLTGVHQLPEGIAGIDILTAESLSDDDRFDRTVNGVVAVIGVADAVASPYAAGVAWRTAGLSSRGTMTPRNSAPIGEVLSAASGTGQKSRTLANPASGSFWSGVKARIRLGSRYEGLYQAAQRNVIRARKAQLAELQSAVGYKGRVQYLHEAGSSTFNHATGEIIIRQHAFHEPGRLKSVFLHELGHSELPVWATEFMVDQRAAMIAERIFGHSDDIILPFTD